MNPVHRIIDANCNRAREAMRVMEEASRFILNDPLLTRKIKEMRHDFRLAIESMPDVADYAIVSRDTPGDVGTGITTESERSRQNIREVVIAAGKRLSESLRAIEEFSKTISPEAAAAIEALRYRGYETEKLLTVRLGVKERPQWVLCLLLTEALCLKNWMQVAEAALRGGADCIQLREKHLPDRELLNRSLKLKELCEEYGAALIINDRADVALLSEATGVHTGQGDLPAEKVRQLTFGRCLMGVSTSNLREAEAAAGAGADYCGVGPMFPSTTKKKDLIAGPRYLEQFTERFPHLPHLAIGGITPENIAELRGVKGVAVSSAICGADDPQSVTAEIVEQVLRQREKNPKEENRENDDS